MTGTFWTFTPLIGLAIAFLGNALRARRTQNPGCLGHVFVASDELTTVELVLNRSGIVVFAIGLIVALAT